MSNDIKIPNSWSVVKLADIATAIQYGYTTSAAEKPVGPRFLRITDIQDNHVDWNTVPFCKVEVKDKSKYLLKQGDIVFARTGATVGKSFLIKEKIPESVFASYLIRVRLKPEIESRYIDYFFKSSQYWTQINESQAGIGQPNVNGTKLAQLRIPLAPQEQQRLIVAEIEKQFSRLEEAVANIKRVKANLKRYRAAVLKAAVEGRLVETEAELARRQGRIYETGGQLLKRILEVRCRHWTGKGKCKEPAMLNSADLSEIPNGWVWTTVGQLGFVKGGKRLPAGHNYAGQKTPYPYIRVTDFNQFGVKESELEYLSEVTRREIERYTIAAEDVYISIAGTIGLVGQVPKQLGGANLTENAAKITGFSDIDPKYLIFWLASPRGMEYITQSTIATTQAKLALFRIEQIPVPLPPQREQQRIIAEVERRLSLIREVEAQVEVNLVRAERLRQAILNKAFAGGLLN